MESERLDIERALFLRIANGDEAAFAKLFHLWRDKLYFFILRITHSPEMAEDVLQDVFTKLWINRAKMTDFEYFQAYFYKMAQNHAISLMRRMAQETIILAELKKEMPAASPSLDEGMFQKELDKKMQAILEKLPPQQRLVYKMTREEGLKQEQIALQLKISPSTVKNHMTCALRTIRHDLLQYFRTTDFYLLVALFLSRH